MDEETDEETGGDGRGDRPATTNRYRTVTASDGQAGRPTMCQQRTSSDGRAATDEQRRASDGQADGPADKQATGQQRRASRQTSDGPADGASPATSRWPSTDQATAFPST